MKKASYKIRFNEAKTVKAVNAIFGTIAADILRRSAATTNEVTVTVGPNGEVSVQPGITTSDPGPTVPTGNQ